MAQIEIDGLREFQRAVRQAKDRELNKRLGQANKKVGQMVVDRLTPNPDPRATGIGKGATVRPSASKREVILRVGGTHRSKANAELTRMQPWGATRVARAGTTTPKRPYILGTAETNFDTIEEAWMDAVMDAFRPAFAEASR